MVDGMDRFSSGCRCCFMNAREPVPLIVQWRLSPFNLMSSCHAEKRQSTRNKSCREISVSITLPIEMKIKTISSNFVQEGK